MHKSNMKHVYKILRRGARTQVAAILSRASMPPQTHAHLSKSAFNLKNKSVIRLYLIFSLFEIECLFIVSF